MYKKMIKYTDFNDNEREEPFYFHLSKHELINMQLSAAGGLEAYINRIIETSDTKKIMEIFEEVVLNSYGIKSDDGLRFDKSEEIRNSFKNSAAFDALVTELMTNVDAATEFINGIVPAMPTDRLSAKQDVSNTIAFNG